jgi:hypothetical protein
MTPAALSIHRFLTGVCAGRRHLKKLGTGRCHVSAPARNIGLRGGMKSKTSRVGVMALPRRKVGVRRAERIGYTYHAPEIITVHAKT